MSSYWMWYFKDPSTLYSASLVILFNDIHWFIIVILGFVYYLLYKTYQEYKWQNKRKIRIVNYFGRIILYGRFFHYLKIFGNNFIKAKNFLMFEYLQYIFYISKIWTDVVCYMSLISIGDLLHKGKQNEVNNKGIEFFEVHQNVVLPSNTELALACLYAEDEWFMDDDWSTVENYLRNTITTDREWITRWYIYNKLINITSDIFNKGYGKSLVATQGALMYERVQRIRESNTFEYTFVIVPLYMVLSMLYPAICLIYSGSEAITPASYFKIIGHQWFWSYELNINFLVLTAWILDLYLRGGGHISDTLVMSKDFRLSFESVPISTDELELGAKRLLEVNNIIVLPVGIPIRLMITSGDVLHSWAVPEMAVKVDAVPGRINDSLTILNRPGYFYGQCSELCGIGHGFMPIVVESNSMEKYMLWIHKNHQDK